MLALLPLTLDRAIAIIIPLRHKSLVTKRTCVLMFVATWSPLLALLIYDTTGYITNTINILYYNKYHRCVIVGRESYIEQVCLLFAPFLLVLILYSTMLVIITRTRRRCGWFLITSTGIILTSLLSYSPTVISNTWDIPLSYQSSQILTVTLYYTNGIVNPLVYVVAHPVARRHVEKWWICKNLVKRTGSELVQSSVVRSGLELGCRGRSDIGVIGPARSADTVYLPSV